MKEKNKSSVLIILLVILISSAFILYKQLSKEYENSGKEIGYISESSGNDKTQGKEARDFTVYDEDMKKISLSDYRGKKPVVINFWASWCPPCKIEMPYFQEAIEKYKDEDVEILMVNLTDGMRETMDKAKKFMDDNNYTMKTVFDLDSNAVISYGIQAVPRTIFIDIDGNISYDHTGIIIPEILENNIDKLIKDEV